jgi:hypothetical protein
MTGQRITVPRSIRMTPEEVTQARRLLTQYPEIPTEAELLRQAALIGLWVLSAQAPEQAGYEPEALAKLLRYRIAPAIDLIVEQGVLPTLHALLAEREAVAPVGALEAAQEAAPLIDAAAAADMEELGTGFLE